MKTNRCLFAAAFALLAFAAPALRAAEPEFPLKSGYRALTLNLPKHQVRFLNPGDRVDFMVTFEALTKGGKDQVTATLLQNVTVLQVDREAGLVQLQVNPNEAQYAALANQGKHDVWLLKRAEGDIELPPMEMASFRKLFR